MSPFSIAPEKFLMAEDARGSVLGFVQLVEIAAVPPAVFAEEGKETAARPAAAGRVLELRSLVVEPQARGRGIGNALVQRLIAERTKAGDVVYLTTLERTAATFYNRLGFELVERPDVPSWLLAEVALGTVVTTLLGYKLVVMKRVVG